MAADTRVAARRARLEARRERLVRLRSELAATVGPKLEALSALEARRLGRRYWKLGELVARLDRRLA
jgi:hypothetical protein